MLEVSLEKEKEKKKEKKRIKNKKKFGRKIEVDRSVKAEVRKQNSWEKAKYARLHSDPLPVMKEGRQKKKRERKKKKESK